MGADAGGPALPEAERNRLLRRIDWRFLLPRPVPGTVLAAPDEPLRPHLAAAGMRFARDGEAADLAVVTRWDGRRVEDAADRLLPAGVLVCEPRRAGVGPRRLRARLRAAGFTEVSLVWRWPRGSAGPLVWLPPGSPSASQWFLASRARPGTVGRARAAVARAGWRAGRWAGMLRPLCAIATRGDATPWLAGAGESPRSWVLLTPGGRAISKVVAVGIAEGAAAPDVVVKVARAPEAEEPLRREARALAAAADRGVSWAPALLRAPAGTPVSLAQSYHSGSPLMDGLGPGTHRAVAREVTDGLVQMVRVARPLADGWRERLLMAPVDDFCARYAAVVEAGEVARTRALLAALPDVPPAVEQRDCSPWNIVRGPDGGLTLLDWESAEPDGLAGPDLIYYLAFASFAVLGAVTAHQAAAYRRVRDPGTAFGVVARDCEERYAAAAGLDPSAFPALRLLTWIVHTRAEHERMTADAGGRPPAPDALRRGVFITLWREELAIGGRDA